MVKIKGVCAHCQFDILLMASCLFELGNEFAFPAKDVFPINYLHIQIDRLSIDQNNCSQCGPYDLHGKILPVTDALRFWRFFSETFLHLIIVV